MVAGFVIHLVGTFADAGMAIRVKSQNKLFRIIAFCLVCSYTVAWIAWLIWLIVIRYQPSGRVCSGEFLNNVVVTNGYAVWQGMVL